MIFDNCDLHIDSILGFLRKSQIHLVREQDVLIFDNCDLHIVCCPWYPPFPYSAA